MNQFFKKLSGRKKDAEEQEKLRRTITANEFMNIKTIEDNGNGAILYTLDNHLFSFIKIEPFSLELLSQREQKVLGAQFTAEFSSLKTVYKIFSASRPVDVSLIIENLRLKLLEDDNKKRREVLKNKISELNEMALSNEIIEHNFYMVLWLKQKERAEQELLKQTLDAISKFSACKLNAEMCSKAEAIKLLNLSANPNYSHLDSTDMEEYTPFVEL